MKLNWTYWASISTPVRDAHVHQAARNAEGIYYNQPLAKKYGLKETLLVSVISLSDNTASKYIQILKNFLCFTATYGLQPMIYYVVHEKDEISRPAAGTLDNTDYTRPSSNNNSSSSTSGTSPNTMNISSFSSPSSSLLLSRKPFVIPEIYVSPSIRGSGGGRHLEALLGVLLSPFTYRYTHFHLPLVDSVISLFTDVPFLCDS